MHSYKKPEKAKIIPLPDYSSLIDPMSSAADLEAYLFHGFNELFKNNYMLELAITSNIDNLHHLEEIKNKNFWLSKTSIDNQMIDKLIDLSNSVQSYIQYYLKENNIEEKDFLKKHCEKEILKLRTIKKYKK